MTQTEANLERADKNDRMRDNKCWKAECRINAECVIMRARRLGCGMRVRRWIAGIDKEWEWKGTEDVPEGWL
jgi:hypothetical protein